MQGKTWAALFYLPKIDSHKWQSEINKLKQEFISKPFPVPALFVLYETESKINYNVFLENIGLHSVAVAMFHTWSITIPVSFLHRIPIFRYLLIENSC